MLFRRGLLSVILDYDRYGAIDKKQFTAKCNCGVFSPKQACSEIHSILNLSYPTSRQQTPQDSASAQVHCSETKVFNIR
jgi:hypothetical protein